MTDAIHKVTRVVTVLTAIVDTTRDFGRNGPYEYDADLQADALTILHAMSDFLRVHDVRGFHEYVKCCLAFNEETTLEVLERLFDRLSISGADQLLPLPGETK